IWWNNLITQYGELDNDNIGGLGPVNITLKDLQPGTYQFMINYYRDWWRERFYDSPSASCMTYGSPLNAPDDTPQQTGNPCFTQTNITVTVRTYHNSSNPVRTETRILAYPSYVGGAPGWAPEGPFGNSWYVTQIVTVDDQRNVTIGGTAPQPLSQRVDAVATPLYSGIAPRKIEGRQP